MFQYFLLGILTVYIVLPIVDSILSIVTTFLEVIRGMLALKVAKINQEITDLDKPNKSTKRQIGFSLDNMEEVEENESEA